MTDMDKLIQAQQIAKDLPYTKVAALLKVCLFRLAAVGAVPDEYVTLAELDAITDKDPELN